MQAFIEFWAKDENRILTMISLILAVASFIVIAINVLTIILQNNSFIKSERNERFKNAIDQLGNNKNAVVLGGIYTLHRIAKEDKSYRENIFNILCSFVRDTTTNDDYKNAYKAKPSEPIQTILNILCVNKDDFKVYKKFKLYFKINKKLKIDFKVYRKFIINFSNAYLVGANLFKANLTNAILYNANLTDSNLMKANFTGANLYNANLTEAYLIGANLTNANLSNANLTNAYLSYTNLTGAYLENANLINANLMNANLINANLMNANLINAILYNANLTNASLFEANLTNAKLENANFTGANLGYAILTDANLGNSNLTNANLQKANLKGADSNFVDYTKSFEERITSRIGKETDLSGIKGGYDPENPPFKGDAIFGAYTKEEAKEIIKKYNEDIKNLL